ncbi:terpene synthase family protein [Lonsdalea quercina]|uniref:terpene synthase family protein n=1 Tax=Lonsdalea quercina TaxID=71657 RepID=UPI003976776F
MISHEDACAQVKAWGETLSGFLDEHAVEAVRGGQFILHSIRPELAAMHARTGIDPNDEARALAFYQEMALLFWIDDCHDRVVLSPDDYAVVEGILVGRTPDAPTASAGASVLRHRLALLAYQEHDYSQLLADTQAYSTALRNGKRLANDPDRWSYSEHLRNGLDAIGYQNVFGCLSLLWGLEMPRWRTVPIFQNALRFLCAIGRLQNDLHGLANDRTTGEIDNLALQLERRYPMLNAVEFLQHEISGYERMLRPLLETVNFDPVWVRLMETMLKVRAQYYETSALRYRVDDAATPHRSGDLRHT